MTTDEACRKNGWTICERRPEAWAAVDTYERRVVHGTQADSEDECRRLTAIVGAETYARAIDARRDNLAYARS